MEPLGIIGYTIFILTMGGLWLKDEAVSIDTIQSEERFVVEDTVYRCQSVQNIYEDPAPQIVRVPTYIEKPCPTCAKPIVKPKKPVKPKSEDCK